MLGTRPVIAILALLLGQQSLHAQPTWTDLSALDSRDPIEMAAHILLDLDETILYEPVLFAGTPNALEVVRVDTAVSPPTASPVPVATGNIFALGTMVSIPGKKGFSFVDAGYDARFGHCAPPCDSVTNSPVVTGTFVDSDSAASASHLWVAALNNTVPRRLEIRTSPDGIVWTPLYNYTPPESAGVCGQYNGCGRINLVVDPTATGVATALSCVTFEVKTSANTTERRVLCFLGSAPQFVTPIDTDSTYASPVLDRVTDTEFGMFDFGELRFVGGAYNHRQTNTVRAFQFDPTTLGVTGPVELGGAPVGSNPFGLSFVYLGGERIRAVWPSTGVGLPANDVEWDPAAAVPLRQRQAFSDYLQQVALQVHMDASQPENLFMRALFGLDQSRFEGPAPESGLAISSFRLPLFDDDFETANTLRWSATSP